jgi:hypothetical protein
VQNGSSLNITVDQTQSHVSVPFFELPIPIELKALGHDTVVRLNNTFSGQTFSITIPFQVDSVKFDPVLWLITANNSVASVNENKLLDYCSVYPNPVHDKLQIKFSKTFVNMSIKLIDVTGREIAAISANGQKNLYFNTEGLTPGFYLLRFISGEQSATQKIVIQ